jgi:uncharacterized protein (TIGR02145 family)
MKKLLFTIIILGACLVGSSQNWDSVRVGNVDVDSIMLGGVKIWEKPTTPVFDEVIIGTQTWKVKNLDIDDGLGGIYAYNNDENNVATYGRLYTWDAAVRVAASIEGWHLPSDAEWTTLTTYLGGTSVAGGKLKEAGTTHWASPNTGATNESGFTALPGGYRYFNGSFYDIGYYGYWWSATEDDTYNACYRYMSYNYSDVYRANYNKEAGFSVRLVKD